jgi:transposase
MKKSQKMILEHWAGCYRYTYNKTIDLLTNKKNTHEHHIALQNRLVIKKRKGKLNNFIGSKPWLEQCPTAIRKKAVREAKSNLKSCFSNLRNKNINHFETPFKRKKIELLRGWCLSMERLNVQKDGNKLFIYKALLGEVRYCNTKQLHKCIPNRHPEMDCKIQKDEFGDYYLILSVTENAKQLKTNIHNVISIDPGVRKFAVSYSLDGAAMYGCRWATRIVEMCLWLDKLKSQNASLVGKSKMKNHRKQIQLRKKIHNLKKELRHQVANDIVKSTDLVMMPKLNVGDMVIKTKRQLRTKTVRSLLMACHGMFFDHLKFKCAERGVHFMQTTEQYTSKTCPSCGHLTKCNEVFHCSSCGFKHDRDVVGALNILLRAVRDAPFGDAGS